MIIVLLLKNINKSQPKEKMHRGGLGGSQTQSFCILRTHYPLDTLISPTSKLIQASDIQNFIGISLWRHD